MTEHQQKLTEAFSSFVRSNYFIEATFGVVYFNLHQAAFMDYLLRTDIVFQDGNTEIGLTGAKIYDELFYHLFLIPFAEIKGYLINNFPETYSRLNSPNFFKGEFIHGIDYVNHRVNEESFIQYSNIETYYR
jgi:hypothetical protein